MLLFSIHRHVYPSTYLCLFQILSSVSYNFLSTGLLTPWLNLLLGINSFYAIVNGIVFLISLSYSLLLLFKMQLISEH